MVSKKQSRRGGNTKMSRVSSPGKRPGQMEEARKLEVVLKCDVSGTLEAVRAAVDDISVAGVEVAIIQSGVGRISKNDVLMAKTGSHLILGFNVSTVPKLGAVAQEQGVEIRLYDVIYRLTADLTEIARSLLPVSQEEKILGRAKVIATFGRRGKGMVMGCEVLEGMLVQGKPFRIITAMGPAYTGRIASLQVERQPVREGRAGQQVGLDVPDWHKAKVGDLVECLESGITAKDRTWRPQSGIRQK